MDHINRHVLRAGITLALAGTTLATAQDGASPSEVTNAAHPVSIDTSETNTGAGSDLPEIIAGPFQHGNSAYYLLEPSTWEMSEAAAQERLGAHLVTINDAVENDFIRNNVLNFDGNDRNGWLGLTDRDSEGNYVWVNNEPVGYTKWAPGEPNGGASENYAGMVQTSPFWFDLQNNWGDLFTPMYGVIEVGVPGVEAGPFYYNGHTYYLLGDSNRHEADTAARLLGGHLVTLDDQEELDWVYANVVSFNNVGRRAWIGLSDERFEGIYAWDNDSLSLYRNWVVGEPQGGVFANYVIMGGGGGWFDADYNWGPGGEVVHSVVEIASPNPCQADLNNDGQLDFFDVSAYISLFGNGCP